MASVNDLLIMKFTAKHLADSDRHGHVRCEICKPGRLLVQLKKDHGLTSTRPHVHTVMDITSKNNCGSTANIDVH